MILWLLLLSSNLWAQTISSPTVNSVDSVRLDYIETQVRDLRSGRPSVTGQPIFLNGIKISSGIEFSDGTILVSSPSATTTVFVGTTTNFNKTITISNTALGPVPVEISTLTYSPEGKRVNLIFSCSCQAQNTQNILVGALIDGQFFDGQDSDTGLIDINAGTTQGINPSCQFFYTTLNTYTGSHTFAITAAAPTGAKTLGSGGQICQFSARDAH